MRSSIGINYDLSRLEVETLIAAFLTGALGIELERRLTDLGELPPVCRAHVRLAEASGRAWTAWSTLCGPIAAWGYYDIQGSKQISAYLLLVEWCGVLSGHCDHHSLWCYSYPKHPREWIVGRGPIDAGR